jgi:T-complex protein 1 subunit gamma
MRRSATELQPSSSWVRRYRAAWSSEVLTPLPAGEILAQALPQLDRNIHPVVIISAFKRALKDALEIIEEISLPIDVDDDKAMYQLISSSIGTKFVSRWMDLMCDLALKAVRTVTWEAGNGKTEVDIKRYARVEKVPGGEIEDSKVLDGLMLNKDITHPKMRRRIENPRIVLLDCPLEYKKGESQTNIEITKEDDWNRILQIEEEQVKAMCEAIISVNPDLVITEKGVSGASPTPLIYEMTLLIQPRPCSALLHEGQHHSSPPSPKD